MNRDDISGKGADMRVLSSGSVVLYIPTLPQHDAPMSTIRLPWGGAIAWAVLFIITCPHARAGAHALFFKN